MTSHNHMDQTHCCDVESGAGRLSGADDSMFEAARERTASVTLDGCCDAKERTAQKRPRSASFHGTREPVTECLFSVKDSFFQHLEDRADISLTVSCEALDSDDECTSGNQNTVTKDLELQLEEVCENKNGECRRRSSVSSAAISVREAEPLEESAEATSTSRCVTVCVPTMFTTAAGRPICVRENRVINADSPYWKLLSFTPEREASLIPSTLLRECETLEAKRENPVTPLRDTKGEPERLSEIRELSETDKKLPSSMHLVGNWFAPRRLRASSCPERCQSATNATEDEQRDYALPGFTGFCAANGRPFFAS